MKFRIRKNSAQSAAQSPAPAPDIRLRSWIGLAALGFLLGLIAFMPASLFEGLANRALAPQAQVRIGDGSIWAGRGVLSLTAGGGANNIPFSWRFDPPALLRLRAGVKLDLDSAVLAGKVRVALGIRSIEVRDASLRIDASLIGAANSMAGLLGPAGSLLVETPAGEAVVGSYRGPLLAGGNLKVRAENILLRTVAARALGNYDIDVALRDTAAEFRITQASGPLKLDGGGSIKWSLPHQLSYRGIAGAPADAAEVLAPLRLIGRPMADGRVQIDYQGGW